MRTKRTVIYLDDDQNLRTLMAAAYRRHRPEYEFICFSSPPEMLKHLGTSPGDLLLLDYILPEIGTEQLLGLIGKISKIPVILISGHDLSGKAGALGQQVIGTIIKPFSMKTICEEVDRLLELA